MGQSSVRTEQQVEESTVHFEYFILTKLGSAIMRRVSHLFSRASKTQFIVWGMFVLGAVLFSLTVYGSFIGVEAADVGEGVGNFTNDSTLSYKEAESRLTRPIDNRTEFVFTATHTVNQRLAHNWSKPHRHRLRLTLTPQRNWLLWGLGQVGVVKVNEVDGTHRYRRWEPTLRRGVGMCGQHNIALMNLLWERGYSGRYVALGTHIVLEVDTPSGTYTLDPDYGVVIPHDTETLISNHTLVRQQYRPVFEEHYRVTTAEGLQMITSHYRTEEVAYTVPFDPETTTHGHSKLDAIDSAKWIIPIILMLTAGRRIYVKYL